MDGGEERVGVVDADLQGMAVPNRDDDALAGPQFEFPPSTARPWRLTPSMIGVGATCAPLRSNSV